VSSQLPPEQSVAHGDEAHEAVQLPDEQAHVLPVQDAALREAAVPGSAMAGPPFGPPLVVVVLDPPHARMAEKPRIHATKRERIVQAPLSGAIARSAAHAFTIARNRDAQTRTERRTASP
jgi:hypothetical protein